MTSKIITTSKPITFRQALAILANINVSYGIFDEYSFTTLVKKPYNRPMPSPEEICDLIAKQNFKTLANDIKRSDRQNRKGIKLRKEKMKAWSLIQRRGLLIGQRKYRKAQISFLERYEFFYQEVCVVQPVFPLGTRGPEQYYDRVALTTATALKFLEDIDWLDLPTRLRDAGIDCRLSRSKKEIIKPVPSHQTFFQLFKQIDINEIHKLLKTTDVASQAKLATWFDKELTPLYAADGSGHPLQGEELGRFKGKTTYRKRSTHVVVVQNLNTRTIRGLFYPTLTGESRKDIRGFIQNLPAGAKLLADREFDVEYLQKEASTCQIDLQARPNLRKGQLAKSPFRRKAHREFNAKQYRLRKIHESIFSILGNRGVLVPRRTSVKLAARATFWACVGHNLDCLLNLELTTQLFRWVDIPIQPTKSPHSCQVLNQENNPPKMPMKEPYNLETEGDSLITPFLETVSPVVVSSSCQPALEAIKTGLSGPLLSNPEKRNLSTKSERNTPPLPSLVLPWSLFSDRFALLILIFLVQCYPKFFDRKGVYQALKLPRSTVYDGIQRLIQVGLVKQSYQYTGGRGRPRTIYSVCYPASDRGPP